MGKIIKAKKKGGGIESTVIEEYTPLGVYTCGTREVKVDFKTLRLWATLQTLAHSVVRLQQQILLLSAEDRSSL